MQSIQEIEQLDLWEDFFRNEHKTKIERLNLGCYSSWEKNMVEQTVTEIESFKTEFEVNYLAHRVMKSGSRIILQSLIQTVIQE